MITSQVRFSPDRRYRYYLERRWDAAPACCFVMLNPATDNWQGADTTVFSLQKAIALDEPFYCHEPFERIPGGWKFDPEKAVLCAGYAIVVDDPDTKRAFIRSIRPDLTDAQADELAGLVASQICKVPS